MLFNSVGLLQYKGCTGFAYNKNTLSNKYYDSTINQVYKNYDSRTDSTCNFSFKQTVLDKF